MCAILDTNVVHEVFGANPTPAGMGFYDWVRSGTNWLVVGGKLLRELDDGSNDFRVWRREAALAGWIRICNEEAVANEAKKLEHEGKCISDDEHVVALAQVSGARLLYSNDKDLHKDFRNKSLIDRPRGQIYSTGLTKTFDRRHRSLLQRKNLCAGRR